MMINSGPCDALRIVVLQTGNMDCLVMVKLLMKTPWSSHCPPVVSCSKLADDSWTACPGIQGYTTCVKKA